MPKQDPLTEAADEKSLSRDDAIGTAKWLRLLIVLGTVLGLVAVCGVAIRLGMEIHHTLLLFSLGGLVAYAIDPLVERLRQPAFGGKVRLSRTMAVLAVFFGLFLCFLGATWWLGDQAASQFKAVQKDAPEYKVRALGLAREFDDKMLRPRHVDFSVEKTIQNPPPEYTSYVEQTSKKALPFLAHTASNLAESAVVLFIALYLLIFSEDMKVKFNGLLPEKLKPYAVSWQIDANRILGGFVRGQLILAMVTGVAASIGLLVIGVHLWLVIGLFVIAASLIPVFGPYIGAVPAVLAAVVGPTRLTPVAAAIYVIVLFVILNEGGSKILYPKLVGKALNLQEVVVLFVIFAGLEIDGVIGTLFAAPVAALAIITVIHLYRLWQELPEESVADRHDQKTGQQFEHGRVSLFKKSKGAAS